MTRAVLFVFWPVSAFQLQSFMRTLLEVHPEGSCTVVAGSFFCVMLSGSWQSHYLQSKSLEGSVVKPCQLVFAPGVRQSGVSRALYLSDLPLCGQFCVTCVEPYFGFWKCRCTQQFARGHSTICNQHKLQYVNRNRKLLNSAGTDVWGWVFLSVLSESEETWQ